MATTVGDASVVPKPMTRAALIFTGHLRSTCEREHDAGVRALVAHAILCRAAFDACDVFLHTWDLLDKPLRNLSDYILGPKKRCGYACRTAIRHNSSSWPCVARVVEALDPSAVAVERQDRAAGYPEDERKWNRVETLRSFRMNGASMAAGALLVRRHAMSMGHTYHAAVRMRADVGSVNIDLRGGFRVQFLDNGTWPLVRRMANMQRARAREGAPSRRREVALCDFPRLKRIDFCSLSVPAEPLLDTLAALPNELAGDEGTERQCFDYLNSSRFVHPMMTKCFKREKHIFSESVLYCAMYAARVTASAIIMHPRRFGSTFRLDEPNGTRSRDDELLRQELNCSAAPGWQH